MLKLKLLHRTLAVLLVTFVSAALCVRADEPQYVHAQMQSGLLSQFWGQPISIDAYVLLPDSYYREPQRRYPIFYWVQGFGGVGEISMDTQLQWQRSMRRLNQQFIVVEP